MGRLQNNEIAWNFKDLNFIFTKVKYGSCKKSKTNPDKSAFKCWLIGKFYHLQILFTSITLYN